MTTNKLFIKSFSARNGGRISIYGPKLSAYGKCNYRIVFHDVHMVGMPIGTDIEGFEWVWNN